MTTQSAAVLTFNTGTIDTPLMVFYENNAASNGYYQYATVQVYSDEAAYIDYIDQDQLNGTQWAEADGYTDGYAVHMTYTMGTEYYEPYPNSGGSEVTASGICISAEYTEGGESQFATSCATVNMDWNYLSYAYTVGFDNYSNTVTVNNDQSFAYYYSDSQSATIDSTWETVIGYATEGFGKSWACTWTTAESEYTMTENQTLACTRFLPTENSFEDSGDWRFDMNGNLIPSIATVSDTGSGLDLSYHSIEDLSIFWEGASSLAAAGAALLTAALVF